MLRALPAGPRREIITFASVGAGVALVGHAVLAGLLAGGLVAWCANVVTALLTLQLNYAANLRVTWRRRVAGSQITGWNRWRRFHVARGAGLAVNVVAFPHLLPLVGVATAYWSLFVACGVLNYLSDRHWSFSGSATARRTTAALALGALVVVLATAVTFLDVSIIVVSVLLLVVTVTTLAFQLRRWWRPEHNDADRYGRPDAPRLPGAILVPMRHEESVAAATLDRLAQLDHPEYVVVVVVDHRDDERTAAVADAKAAEHPGRVLVCEYPHHTDVHNKPIGLNAAVQMLDERGLEVQWVGIADAEDLFHPQLLRVVDYRLRTTGAGIIQCGVQLMNFSCDPSGHPLPAGRLARVRRWWHANTSGWWRAANVLEYFKWFQSLKLQAELGVMPLGGNTVFFRREVLEELHAERGTYWDESCLTEDCMIGVEASVRGHQVDVVYLEELVTMEETPPTLRALLRQRVRWMQGFIQVFRHGGWRRLPTRGQRVVACYVLGFQFFQAASVLLAPVALALALWHKSPVGIALLASLPLSLGLLTVALDLLMLRLFAEAFHTKALLRDYVGVAVGAYPYQLVLSAAAGWAFVRELTGRNDWHKTQHLGAHLEAASTQPAQGALAGPR